MSTRPKARIIGRRGPATRKAPARNGARPASPKGGISFHPPSFSIGLILGAAVVLVTGYLPELLAPGPEVATSNRAGRSADRQEPPLRFEFDQILRSSPPADADATTGADAQPAATPEPPESSTGEGPGAALIPVEEREGPTSRTVEPAAAGDSRGQMLQAASFKSRAEAERLRAELLLLDLPASTGAVTVGDAQWYRVTVGPFADQAATDAARERLQARNLSAIPLRP